jgi:hypothetical protein
MGRLSLLGITRVAVAVEAGLSIEVVVVVV